jgi:hypothetical protein
MEQTSTQQLTACTRGAFLQEFLLSYERARKANELEYVLTTEEVAQRAENVLRCFSNPLVLTTSSMEDITHQLSEAIGCNLWFVHKNISALEFNLVYSNIVSFGEQLKSFYVSYRKLSHQETEPKTSDEPPSDVSSEILHDLESVSNLESMFSETTSSTGASESVVSNVKEMSSLKDSLETSKKFMVLFEKFNGGIVDYKYACCFIRF